MMLTAVDNLYLYSPEFEAGANRFEAEVAGSTETCPIPSPETMKQATRDFCNVKFLCFDTHGRPGAMQLTDGTLIESFRMLVAPSVFLWNDARILFFGCNVGEGLKGEEFLDDVGAHLLRGHGGIVGATTVENFTFSWGQFSTETYMEFLAQKGGILKARRYDRSGHLTGFLNVDRHGHEPLGRTGRRLLQ